MDGYYPQQRTELEHSGYAQECPAVIEAEVSQVIGEVREIVTHAEF